MAIFVEVAAAGICVSADDYRIGIRDAEITITSIALPNVVIARSATSPPSEHEIAVPAGRLVRWWYPSHGSVAFEWVDVHDPHRIVTTLTISDEGPLVRLSATDVVTGEATLARLSTSWEFLAGPRDGARPDFIWTPALCPKPGQVVGRHFFRSPAAIIQHGDVALALVPDLDRIARDEPLEEFLDLACPRGAPGPPMLTAGVAAYRVDGHVAHTTDGVPPRVLRDATIGFGCALHVDVHALPMRAHQEVARAHWKTRGRAYLRDVRPQVMPFARYYEAGYRYADEHLWRETNAPGTGARRVGAMTISREYPGDVWFQGWFNQLRTAWGLYWWARRLEQPERQARAIATRELVLSAPQDRGLFPTIAILPEKEANGNVAADISWVASTLQGGGPDLYHLLDCSWTAWWLLRWHADLLPDERTISFCRAYADALLALQRPDGGWPDYVDTRSHRAVTEYDGTDAVARTNSGYLKSIYRHWDKRRLATSAESAADALFLAELAKHVPDGEPYLAAAERTAEFLATAVIPRHRWFDFETFFSCSPKPIDFFDARTQQHPQNTLSLYWAAELFRALYEATHKAVLGEQAVALMDYLCLYQQVWTPPFLSFYGFGGFGVMNTDGEWNDARQAVFAEGLAMQYLQSGRQEYLERAVAATRAGFSCMYVPENAGISPKTFDRKPTGYADENYAHSGYDYPAGPSGFDWGAGSAITAAARMVDLFGDLWIDVADEWALGIDGLVVRNYIEEDGVWYLEVDAPFRHASRVTVKGNPGEGESLVLVVNGFAAGTVSAEELRKGREVRIG